MLVHLKPPLTTELIYDITKDDFYLTTYAQGDVNGGELQKILEKSSISWHD